MKYKDFNHEVICINTFEIREYDVVFENDNPDSIEEGERVDVEEIEINHKRKEIIIK